MTLSPATRDIVYARAERACERCGVHAYGGSVHHRRPRGMGGDKRPDTDMPANLVLLCGSGVTGCHGWIESERVAARELGLLLPKFSTPMYEPVTLRYGRVLLDNSGFYELAA